MTTTSPEATRELEADGRSPESDSSDAEGKGPKSVACPTCGADPGEPCRRPSGHEVWNGSGNVHAARRKNARPDMRDGGSGRSAPALLRSYDGGEIGIPEMEAALQVSSDALTEAEVAAGAWRVLKSAQIMARHGRTPRTDEAQKMIGQVPFRIAEVKAAARAAGIDTEALAETLSPPVPNKRSGEESAKMSGEENERSKDPDGAAGGAAEAEEAGAEEAEAEETGGEEEKAQTLEPMPQGHRRSFREWRAEVDEALADAIGVVTAVLPGVAWRRAYHRGMTTTSAAEQARWMWSNGAREEEEAKRRKRRLTVLMTSDRPGDVKAAADEASEDLIRAALRLCGPSQQRRIESALTDILRKRHPES